MSGKCENASCAAPDIPCHLGHDNYLNCPQFKKLSTQKKVTVSKNVSSKKSNVNWSGEAFTINDIIKVSNRTSPILIGIVGKAAAGKTSFLAMLYTLLLNGKELTDFNFSGSKTIIGWDELHHRLKLKKGEVPFPPPTPVASSRIYHLALRDSAENLKDVLFSDASGEVFSLWAMNREDENAENARWIYSNSSAFMLFIDCQALIDEKNLAKREIMYLAKQLSHDLYNRPVIAVWSKSEKKSEILPQIRESLQKELNSLFNNFKEIEISNFLEPGPDYLVHNNNLAAVDWLLEKSQSTASAEIIIESILTNDTFITYRGK